MDREERIKQIDRVGMALRKAVLRTENQQLEFLMDDDRLIDFAAAAVDALDTSPNKHEDPT